MSLYISINTPDRNLEMSPIDEAITFIAAQVAMEKRSGLLPSSGPALDVTFMLSTVYDAPPFSGMRMGGYTENNKTLYFETAVPEVVGRSGQASRYVAAVLQDVVDHAIEYFNEQKIPFDSASWLRAVDYLAGLEAGRHLPH